MTTPEDAFRDIWRTKMQDDRSCRYIAGENRRVDSAVQALSGGLRLLDIGCGAGVLGSAVKNKYREVHGIDIAEEAVRLARENGVLAQRLDLNRESLPFDDGSFDTVTALSVLPYLYDPRHVLSQCHRVLRYGGEFVLSVANMRSAGKLFQQFVRGRFPITSKLDSVAYDGGAMHYFCYKNVKELLEEAGFRIVFRKGIFCRPRIFERVSDRSFLLGVVKAEFFSGETFIKSLK